MALPPFQRFSFEPSEQVFLTIQSDKIHFIPNFTMSRFRSLDGTFIGPFTPLKPIELPLWCAIQCKKKRKGKIVCPEWIKVESLEDSYKREISDPAFSDLPFHWLELSKLLIDIASDDIPSLPQVRSFLKALREVRQTKLRKGLTNLDGLHLETPHLSSLELNELRPTFSVAHLKLLQLNPQAEAYDQFLTEFESQQTLSGSQADNTFLRASSTLTQPSDEPFSESFV
ncbi:hypothetical protein CROQUDRAFT_667073 [Cronartium quercuum f. sp. fusiforme G11]|uniref:DNA replication complex GINS protein PSF2 n=1 Tax=Cronartium quercuum f. sp. fusiforme G11 TaxID=708437 RepID=A0A9P6N4R8_9BASI|nr:hypothetical protein CROQUDRAFT_667073 [Cronartium quercuum f. sp. fusiforme G11]